MAGAEKRPDYVVQLAGGRPELEFRPKRLYLVAQRVEPVLAAVAQKTLEPRFDLGAFERARGPGSRTCCAHVFEKSASRRHAVEIVAQRKVVRLGFRAA